MELTLANIQKLVEQWEQQHGEADELTEAEQSKLYLIIERFKRDSSFRTWMWVASTFYVSVVNHCNDTGDHSDWHKLNEFSIMLSKYVMDGEEG